MADFRGDICTEKAPKIVPLLYLQKLRRNEELLGPPLKNSMRTLQNTIERLGLRGSELSGGDVHRVHVLRNVVLPTKFPVAWKGRFPYEIRRKVSSHEIPSLQTSYK